MTVTHGTCGPIAWLIVGKVWSVDFFDRVGIYGVGWIIAFRKVKR